MKTLHPFHIDNLACGLAQVFADTPELNTLRIVGHKEHSDGLLAFHVKGDVDWRLLNSHPIIREFLELAATEIPLTIVSTRTGTRPFVNLVMV